ncbi:probable RNA-directed DNA polymerase from transposon X-element [Trichonephila clavipes]|nr:probable RNA-directed DNA polymerase from transposon X-element [Trichonephila clavipes]
MTMISHKSIGLKLFSWNANGILNKISEFKIFVEKHSPDLALIQETHLRPHHNINITNYNCYRNDRIGDGIARGGTLILVRKNISHYNIPTPTLNHIEATVVVITPQNLNPISIYVPPTSDARLFTLDLENLLQTNSNCVIFGDFNATHNMWNCPNNSIRGCQLKTFAEILDLTIAFPDTPTRFGSRSANTLDFALINNFNFPFNINSIAELSSDHNPVILNFSLLPPIHQDNSRAVTTCWSTFKNNLYVVCLQPPLELRRKQLSANYFIRAMSVPSHPLKPFSLAIGLNRLYEARSFNIKPFSERAKTILNVAHLNDINIQENNILAFPPWDIQIFNYHNPFSGYDKAGTAAVIYQQLFSFHRNRYSKYIPVYTDGSKTAAHVGCGVVFNIILSFSLHNSMSVFSAELTAILVALQHIIVSNHRHFCVYTDSMSALESLHFSTEHRHPTVIEILLLLRKLERKGFDIIFSWVPGHVGILGNEQADTAARSMSDHMQRPVCYRVLKTSTQNYIHRVWQETWDQQVLNKLHSIHPSTSHWAALPVRRHDVHLTRLRIGHTRFTHRHLLLGIKIPTVLEEKIEFFTAAVRSAHQFASKPIANKNHAYTPNYIHNLIRDKNRAKKKYNNTLNPVDKQNYYRLQEKLKKELKKISQENWNNKLESLNTRDNSLWQCQKFFRKKRSNIPSLTSSSGVANSDEQKANTLASTLKNNFSENKRPGDGSHPIDQEITNTLNNFFDNHPLIPISPTDPDEILTYIKSLKNNKAPGSDLITNKMVKNLPIKIIMILTYLINKILFLRHFPNNWKNAIVFPIKKPNKNAHNPDSYRPISLLSILSKITEYIILNRLKSYTNENNFINPNQYGFTRNLSTYHPLLGLTEKITAGFQRQVHWSCLS